MALDGITTIGTTSDMTTADVQHASTIWSEGYAPGLGG